MNMRFLGLSALISLLGAVSCQVISPDAPSPEEVLAEPIEGMSNAQLVAHIEGDEDFAQVFSTEDGLGPIFVAASCEGCHVGDGKGHPLTVLTRFGRDNGGTFDPMVEFGGPQLQERSVSGYQGETIPEVATGITRLIAPPVTGLGYLEELADSSILAHADPNDDDGDGVSGVASYVDAPDFFTPTSEHIPSGGKYIGRFGKKATALNLTHQTANAYLNDMGISSDFHPDDLYNPLVGPFAGDIVDDPEISAKVVHNVSFYLKTLKAPTRINPDDSDVLAGEVLFTTVGCEKCHVSSYITGPSEVDALDQVEFAPFTDLLLHDMGAGLDDGYTEGAATSAEWRTAPLWGMGVSQDSQGGNRYLLHDGRASSVDEAIQFHGGEGSNSRTAYNALSTSEKDQLLKFIDSL